MNSVFVTGTDTDVGKTRISLALLEQLQQTGLRIAAMKPIASGCERTEKGLRNDDALHLNQQTNIHLDYKLINPYAFEPAIAPHIAAQQIGVEIDIDTIIKHYQKIQQQADIVVVEGAGGWLVPLNQHQTMADLALALGLPIILIVAIRLGCINHALLTVAAIKQTGLTLQGWVANQIEKEPQSANIITTLQQHIKAPCLGRIPTLKTDQSAAEFLKFSEIKRI